MPSTILRKQVLAEAQRVVVKIGTQLLARSTAGAPEIDLEYVNDIADQIASLRKRGLEVTLVCSGAIGAGCVALDLNKRPKDVSELQAVAAVGQRLLMTHFHDAFGRHKIEVGQVLLTRRDFDNRVRFLNIRNCVTHLHSLGCIPIINENDAVAVEELRFGDNDTLAALMTNALRADALVLLTVVEGLLDADENVIELVDDIADVAQLAQKKMSDMGTGGMQTKLEAARLATEAGEIAVIANGREPDVLPRLFDAETIGTVFVPATKKLDSRSRWIALTKRPSGTVTIDDGAANALRKRGKSLLASGITATTGQFDGGEVIMVRDQKGLEIARGLSNYNSDEIHLIAGKRSNQFEKILGRKAYDEIIHRDNLVLING